MFTPTPTFGELGKVFMSPNGPELARNFLDLSKLPAARHLVLSHFTRVVPIAMESEEYVIRSQRSEVLNII